jgi:alpha-aminoadipate carrier protein LysW
MAFAPKQAKTSFQPRAQDRKLVFSYIPNQPSSILRRKIMVAECPECAAEIQLADDTIVHEIVVCPDCGMELEVLNLDPPTVDYAPQEEEDWGE